MPRRTGSKRVEAEVNDSRPGRLLFVGRDPGETEIATGQPFVGDAGEVLDRTLALAGLRRQDVNITNRVPWRPDNNVFGNHDPSHVQQGLIELNELIDRLKPSLIVTMGNEAAYSLVKGWPGDSIYKAKGILDRRGFFWPDYRGSPVMTTIHPALVTYKTMPNKMLLDIDMLRIREYNLGNLPRVDVPLPKIASKKSDMDEVWENDKVAFDIETTWGGSRLLCVGFYGENMKRPLVVLGKNYHWCLKWIRSQQAKITHNGQFDRYFLRYKVDKFFQSEIPLQYDTSVLHWALYPELAGKEETGGEGKKELKQEMTRKSLLFLASMHMNVPWWKDYTKDTLRMAELCGQDVFVTRHLHDIMEVDAVDEGVIGQYQDAMRRIPTLNKMQSRGLRVDQLLWKKRVKKLKARQETLEKQVHDAAMKYILANKVERFAVVKQCKCCGGGKVAREQCWRCAGFEKKPGRAELAEKYDWIDPVGMRKMKKAELEASLLESCESCQGLGSTTTYEFNPMSPKQLGDLLYTELKVPMSTLVRPKDGIKADEETIKRVLEWSEQ